jgi:hypothetical protein
VAGPAEHLVAKRAAGSVRMRGTPASSISPVSRDCSARSAVAPARAWWDWLRERTPEFREAIRFVAIDPAAVYAKAIRTEGLLPNATLVVDHFHLVKLANDAVTKVRRRVIWEHKGRRGRKIDPAWANRRRLLTGFERLSGQGFRDDVELVDRLRSVGADPHRLDREGGTAQAARTGPH